MNNVIASAITDCGDLAVLLPLAVGLAVILWRFESRSAVWAWLRALAFCMGATLLLKISFLACGHVWGVNIVSPSGHASMSTMVYGALTLVLATHIARWRAPIVLSGVFLVGAIALTRTTLHIHTNAEVGIGLVVGLASLWIFAWEYSRLAHSKINLPIIGVGALCVFALLHGVRLPAESLIYEFAHSVRTQTHICRPTGATTFVPAVDTLVASRT